MAEKVNQSNDKCNNLSKSGETGDEKVTNHEQEKMKGRDFKLHGKKWTFASKCCGKCEVSLLFVLDYPSSIL